MNQCQRPHTAVTGASMEGLIAARVLLRPFDRPLFAPESLSRHAAVRQGVAHRAWTGVTVRDPEIRVGRQRTTGVGPHHSAGELETRPTSPSATRHTRSHLAARRRGLSLEGAQ
ncbi:hypothetical protein [Deinococcus hopiensis]|uniref:Uncharacterized protein n=1 Tax=Deinococcus hopiensis KR-140 TaxID=695939 RepID=A0A1W1UNC6_9DEIO|nr:hypothetical protein [Deinococcus hopiensis]SMB82602.1 hypothetical protein SAMN00790413_04081 [Deinococcus hopiensis KR-140]